MLDRPPEVTTADLSSADSTTELFRAAIGPVNARHYLHRFARFEAADRASASWNWAAALCTLSWLAFRQLWLAALGYAGAVVAAILLVFGIGRLVFQFSEGVELGLVMGFAIAAFAVPGLYGNALLYAACRKKMAAALASNATVPEACTMLAKRAPTLLRALVLALASAALVGVAVAAYFEFPHPGTFPYNLLKTAQPKADAAPPVAVAPAVPDASGAPSMATAPGTASAPATTSTALAGAPGLDTADETKPAPSGGASATVTPTPTPTSASASASALAAAPSTAVPLAAPSPTVAPAAEAAPAKSQDVKPKDVKAKEAKAPSSKAKPAAEKTAASPKTQAQQKARFYVNVGLFADSNNALNAYVKLTDAGLPALKQEFNTSKGKRTRVRVGPFDNEGEAQTAIEKVHVLGLEAIILRPEKPPEKP